MIHKQGKSEWANNLPNVQRKSISSNAMSSFEEIITKKASSLKEQGLSHNDIAKKLNLPLDLVNIFLQPIQKTASASCGCDSKDEDNNEETLDNAQKAFDELHGNKKNKSAFTETRQGKSISSASGNRTDITEIGGPKKQIKSQYSNSIWEPNTLEKLSKVKGNDEKTADEKALLKNIKEKSIEASRYETIDGESLKEALTKTEQKKTANIQNMSVNEAVGYSKRIPANGMSIFDSGKFDNIPNKTAGELVSLEKKAAKDAPKDRSWAKNTTTSSKDIFNSMIDSFDIQKKE